MNLHRAAAALATVAVLAGCAPTGDGTSETFAPANPTSVTAAVEDILAFGQPATLSDNVTVTVSTPETFAPSANHYPDHPDGVQYRWTVTIKNGSDKPFFMGNMFFDTTIGDVAAGHYSGEGYADYQPTSLLPGKTFTRTAAVSAPTAGDVTVHGWNQVDAETQYEAYWTGPSTKAQAPSASPTAVPESAKPVPAKPAAVEAPAPEASAVEANTSGAGADATFAGQVRDMFYPFDRGVHCGMLNELEADPTVARFGPATDQAMRDVHAAAEAAGCQAGGAR